MQISSKLFNQQQLKQFSSSTEELQDLQNKIASGENILRASDDPVGSVELSGLSVVQIQIEQYERYVGSASDKPLEEGCEGGDCCSSGISSSVSSTSSFCSNAARVTSV